MPGSIRLGRAAGVPVGLHYSWFIIATLITLSLVGHFGATQPDWNPAVIWGASALTAILFFATLLTHELSHAIVARARGLPVRSITLFALGGVAHIKKEASTARTEFLVAIVGPLTSYAIGLICIAIASPMGWSIEGGRAGVIGAVLGWLGSINIVLATFNLVPGYPLDGGRVLRAALWGIYKDGTRATRHAARIGQAVAALFIGLGLLQFLTGAGFGGLWLAFVGWFLLMAAQASYAEVTISEMLRDVRVADIMSSDCATVDAGESVQSLVDDLLLRTGRRCVVVRSKDRALGLVTPRDVRDVERERWADLTAREVMRPLDRLRSVSPEASAAEALTTMTREDLNQLPVVADGRLEGTVSRGQIMQLVQSRAELRA